MHSSCVFPLLLATTTLIAAKTGEEWKAVGKAETLPASGCRATPIGCYSDCLNGDNNDRTLPISPSGCCGDPVGGCPNCPTACVDDGAKKRIPDFEKKVCPAKGHKCPDCDQNSLTGLKCADYCALMNPLFKFSGVEFTTQCFCGTTIHEQAAKADGTTTKCDTPCKGNPAEMCGGSCAITMFALDCSAASWGWPVLVTLFVLSLVYLSAGVAYNIKVKGMQPARDNRFALPHQEQWAALYGLVIDGSRFSWTHTKIAIAKARGLPHEQYEPVPDTAAAATATKKKASPSKPSAGVSMRGQEKKLAGGSSSSSAAAAASAGGGGDAGSSDSDDLVE